jgi:hypothetical protein
MTSGVHQRTRRVQEDDCDALIGGRTAKSRSAVVRLVGVAVALLLPGRCLAIDHTTLFLLPVRLATPPGPLAGWKLSATVNEGLLAGRP